MGNKLTINGDYIFTASTEGEITEDDFDDGILSDLVFDKYEHWVDLNNIIVTVISAKSTNDIAKVFIKSKGFEWWFTAKNSELIPCKIKTNPSPGDCRCDMSLILVRGCQCGGN